MKATIGALLLMVLVGCSSEPSPAKPADEWVEDRAGLSAGLFAVWSDQTGPLWAVGADDGDGPMLLSRPLGASGEWTRVDMSAHPGDLWWICGAGADVRYLVGAGGRVLRWDRSTAQFKAMETPTKRTLYGCWAADAEHIWAVGGDPKGLEAGVVMMSDGVTWTEVTELPPSPAGASFFKVWGTSATDVRVINSVGQSLHFDGSTWTRDDLTTEQRLITIHGDGELTVIVGGTGNGAVFERRDGKWEDRSPEAIQALNGVFVRGDRRFAVGFRGTLIDGDDTGWTLRDETPTDLDLHGVFIDATGTGWAVGGNLFASPPDDGVILRRPPQ